MAGDEDHIYIAHTPTLYPMDPLAAAPMDGLVVVVLIGNDPTSCLPVVLPDAAFSHATATYLLDVPTIVGSAGHGATPVVLRTGSHAATAANTTRHAV